jgi:RNA recognition motif-containing protein
MNIYVGNISSEFKESDLKDIFKKYGEVSSAKISTDKNNGQSISFGFVVMENIEEAQNAIEDLNGCEIDNLEIIVSEAR